MGKLFTDYNNTLKKHHHKVCYQCQGPNPSVWIEAFQKKGSIVQGLEIALPNNCSQAVFEEHLKVLLKVRPFTNRDRAKADRLLNLDAPFDPCIVLILIRYLSALLLGTLPLVGITSYWIKNGEESTKGRFVGLQFPAHASNRNLELNRAAEGRQEGLRGIQGASKTCPAATGARRTFGVGTSIYKSTHQLQKVLALNICSIRLSP
jgi:hypothetical protein